MRNAGKMARSWKEYGRALRVDLIRFRAKHLFEIDPGVTPEMLTMGQVAELFGTGYTAVLCGDPIGAAGIAVVVPGLGEAWSLLSPMMKRFPFALHKAAATLIPEVMKRHNLNRVNATVDASDPIAVRWAERLGFERDNSTDGAGFVLYVRMARGDSL